jgi:murein DD-endopeptidase MepM/ murein hydrolase activator NlpD
MFLKSPIRYSRISSRFTTKRFHPILQFNRPHLGVDYAAPIGTPIRAVGDGVIMSAGRNGGAGNMIKLQHNSTYSTAYKHLNGFAKGIHSGARVHQGQIIGYVGTTGLSTGPHLHFEFFQNGKYVDPLGRKFPSAEPVPQEKMAEFEIETHKLMASLPEWSTAVNLGKTATGASE